MNHGSVDTVVRNPPSTHVFRPSPSVSIVRSVPGRYSSATSFSPGRRPKNSAHRSASSSGEPTSMTSSLATPSAGLSTSGQGSPGGGASPGAISTAMTFSAPVSASRRRISGLFLARRHDRQSLPGSPK